MRRQVTEYEKVVGVFIRRIGGRRAATATNQHHRIRPLPNFVFALLLFSIRV